MSIEGPQDQVSIGQIIETEDGKERVIAVDGQGSYVTEVLDQEVKIKNSLFATNCNKIRDIK